MANARIWPFSFQLIKIIKRNQIVVWICRVKGTQCDWSNWGVKYFLNSISNKNGGKIGRIKDDVVTDDVVQQELYKLNANYAMLSLLYIVLID